MKRIFNFSAGPATLPLDVLKVVQEELLDFQNTGMSIIEMSHRGKVFEAVYFESLDRLRKVASIPDRFDILYMTGGASTQFALIPMNLSGKGRKAGYINTGVWSEKAIEQAKLQDVDVFMAADTQSTNHNHVPDKIEKASNLDYLHMTSNNTIFGTQFHNLPDPGDTKLIIDMSSDFLSKPIDWTHIGMAYAGLQKNAGPAGLTIVIIDKEYYARESAKTPTMFRYSTFAKNDSMYNTPPVFQIYFFNLILHWIEKAGGLVALATQNSKKAGHLYKVIDDLSGFYLGHAQKPSRSLMNVTFNFANKSLEAEFLRETEANGMHGLKGHRLVGGLRASIYNAMPEAGCAALADFMRAYASKHS